MKHQKYSAIATLAVLFALDCSARAAIKASNSNALNDSASWVAGTFPDASQIALYNNTITTGIQNQLGASATWLGISVTDPAGFTNILPTAGATLTLGAAGINLAGSSNSMNLLIPVVLAASQTWNAAAGATLIDSGAALSLGSNTLTLSGAGSISLSGLSGIGNLNIFGTAAPLRVDLGSSTGYSGTISLSQGTLAASTSTSLPSTSVLNLSGGVVNLQGQSTTIKSLTGSGGIINNTTGALAVLTVGTTSGFRSNAQINGNISVVAGNLSLRNTASNYTGTTTINTGGFLGIWSLANAGLPSSIGAAGTSPGNLSLGGTLEYDGDNPASTNRLFFVFGAGTLYPRFAPVAFTNTASNNFGSLTLGGIAPAVSTFAPQINGGNLVVSGNWHLTNANTFSTPMTLSGFLVADTIANGGVASSIGAATNAASNIVFASGWLQYAGTGASTDRLFSGTAPSLDSSGTGPISFTNTGTINVSTLTLAGANAGNNYFSPSIQGSAPLIKLGTGTWKLANSSSMTGPVYLYGGTLGLDYSVLNPATIISNASNIGLDGGQLLITGATAGARNATFARLDTGIGSNSVVLADSGFPLSIAFTTLGRFRGATADYRTSALSTITTSFSNTAGALMGAWATFNQTSWASVNAGAVGAAPNNADSWGAANNPSITSSALHTSETVNSLLFNTPASITLSLAGVNTIASGGILVGPGVTNHPSTISGGSLRSGINELIIHQYNTSAAFTLAAGIVDNGTSATAFTKSGPGVLILAAPSTYSGNTYINEGVVKIGVPNALPVTPMVLNGTLDINGFNTTIGELEALDLGAPAMITNSGAPATLTLTNSFYYFGAITGPITFLKNTGDQVAFNTRMHYTGDTIVAAGELDLFTTAAKFGFDAGWNDIPTTSRVILTGGKFSLGSGYRQDLDNLEVQANNPSIVSFGPFPTGARLHVANLTRLPGTTLRVATSPADGLIGFMIDSLNGSAPANGPSGIIPWALYGSGNTPAEFARFVPGTNNSIAGGGAYVTTFDSASSNTTVSGSVIAPLNATTGTLRFNQAATNTLTLNGQLTLAAGAILVTSTSHSVFINGGPADSLTAPGELILHQYASSWALILATPIVDNGTSSVSLVKAGPGSVILASNNSFTGGITISEGTLTIGDGIAGTAGSGPIVNNTALQIVRTGLLTIPGNISGPGSLTQNGAGTTTLTGSYSATGAIRVLAGKLVFAETSAPRQTGAVLITTNFLDIFSAGRTLDLTNHDLMLTNNTPSSSNTIINTLWKNGTAALTGNGDPSGPQITSSTATNNTSSFPTFLVAFDLDRLFGNGTTGDGSAIGQNLGAYTDNQPVTQPGTIMIKYGYYADLDFSGKVDAGDINLILGALGQTTPGMADPGLAYLTGDIDYSGKVDAGDINLVLGMLGAGNGTTGGIPLATIDAPLSVPEPSTIAIISLVSALCLRRTSRKFPSFTHF